MNKNEQIEIYLKSYSEKQDYPIPEYYISLYNDIGNDYLGNIFASFHYKLNELFRLINQEITRTFNDDGEEYNKGGYLHAQDGRDLLDLFDTIDAFTHELKRTDYEFEINKEYVNQMRECKNYVRKYGGTHIPDGTNQITLLENEPIFVIQSSIVIKRDNGSIAVTKNTCGIGSYADVFYYVDPLYNMKIAVKCAKPELTYKELQRFKREFETLKGLCSPYIIEVFTYNDERNEYTMEYMDKTIDKYISENRDLSLKQRKAIIYQICKGFKYIHSKGLLHRDISLTNIMVKRFDDVDVFKICDFGLVKMPDSQLTSQESSVKGALNDPDLIRMGFDNYEIRHETYALTRLFCFILTGTTTGDLQMNGKTGCR